MNSIRGVRATAFTMLMLLSITWSTIGGAANVVVTISGTRGPYTVQFFKNGTVFRTCNVTNQLGQVNFMLRGVPDNANYFAKVTFDPWPTPSNTWPPKYVTTGDHHLGCLNFDSGTPIPWRGPCPPPCWNCSGSQTFAACN